LLSLPFTLKRTGLVTGIVVMLLIAVQNAGTMVLIARCADMARVYTYKGLAVAAFGPRMSRVVAGTLAFYTLVREVGRAGG